MTGIEQFFFSVGVAAVALVIAVVIGQWLGICRFEFGRTDKDEEQ